MAPRPVASTAYPLSFPAGVRGLPGLIYVSREGLRPLTLDLYLPAESEKPRPLLVFVHGGGWSAGNTRTSGALARFPEVLARFAAAGYGVASVEYRLSGEATFPAALDDLHAAQRWLHEHADEYAIDPDRVAFWGVSAGAHLAALAAFEAQSRVSAFVGWFGIYDLPALLATQGYPDIASATGHMLGCETACSAAVLQDASPVLWATAEAPATLLIHGDADRVVPFDQSRRLAERLSALQVPVVLKKVPGVSHSFVAPMFENTQRYNRESLQATLQFLDSHLKR
ncbi:alpha/beta fold hydrolase [Pseudomonas sp. LRF_L74]|uniref:alpha/beta fold hydrolase n=1 Tax=Pseudomonas sp. LRF_L74 TaxID=3369422 RepID=UPI003F5D6119